MLNKLLMAYFILSLCVCANSSPTSIDCKSSFDNTLKDNAISIQKLCNPSATKSRVSTENEFPYSANANHEVIVQLRAGDRKSSLAEPVTVVLFIPGLIILLFMRLAKSNK